MKKTIIAIYLMILSLGVSSAFAAEPDKKNSDDKTAPANKENKLSEDEINRMTRRVEDIRSMDKSELTVAEKKELRKELKEMKEMVKADGGYLYIGAGTILVIILLVILLL
jgi:peptidoglycan hydrolase CwlO-like protein